MDYVFYFDETYQDRKISIKENHFNSMSENSFDSYIGLFWGCAQSKLHSIIPLLIDFEEKYKSVFGLSKDQELKSDIIKKKNYQNGLKSFNRNAFNYYSDLFDLLNQINPIIQIDAISKVEFFLTELFKNVNLESVYPVNRNAFIYSLTKFILTYDDSDLINSIKIINDDMSANEFRKQLLGFVAKKYTEAEDIGRKAREENTLSEFFMILNTITFDGMKYEKLNYPYYYNFVGFNKLLDELHIQTNKVKITIDEELNTYNSSILFKYKTVKQANSKNSIQIRLCDWLCGFVGRFAYALFNDDGAKELNGESIEKRRLLSKEWFDIDREIFCLYQKINKFFNIDHEYYWTIMTLQYADPIIMFCALLRYFGFYNSYEDYSSKSLVEHQEQYNAMCVTELNKSYEEFNTN